MQIECTAEDCGLIKLVEGDNDGIVNFLNCLLIDCIQMIVEFCNGDFAMSSLRRVCWNE